MAYVIYKSDNSLFLTIEDGQIDQSTTSLTMLGKNVINYGQYENTNLVRLLENFASVNSPGSPMTGQLWFDKSNDVVKLKVYTGTTWKLLPNLVVSTSSSLLSVNDLWWEPAAQILYYKSTSSNVVIGGVNISVEAANRLTTPRAINGVLFSGTASITISSTLTNAVNFNSYLLGGTFNGATYTNVDVDVGIVSEGEPNKVVARDNNGDIWFRIGYGTATASRYADLAEKYLADKEYEVGTVMVIGGTAEVTQADNGQRAIGVVSQNPGFMMNQDLEGGTYIALKGRVPVKVKGSILKGQKLIAGSEGRAISATDSDVNVFAIALEHSEGENTIEALIL